MKKIVLFLLLAIPALAQFTVTRTSENVVQQTGLIFPAPLVTTSLRPNTDDGATLGDVTHNWSDLFMASGAVFNWANGNVVLTHSSGILTLGTGDLRITSPGTNAASVITRAAGVTMASPAASAGLLLVSSSNDRTAEATDTVATINAGTSNVDVFRIMDNVDQSHGLSFVVGSNLTANRSLTINTGDANRALTINGDVILPAGTAAVLAFPTIAVSGQSDVVADSSTDTLTLAAGSNITITTDATTDTITIAASGGSATLTATQVGFGDGSNVLTGDAGLTYNSTTDRLTSLGGVTITQGQANTTIVTATGYSVTGSATTPMLSYAGTWNTSGDTYGLLMDITDTARGANSRLIELRTDGTARFGVDRTGNVVVTGDFFSSGASATAYLGATGSVYFGNRSSIVSSANARIAFLNNAQNATAGILGTLTNNDAAAGDIGEYVSSLIATGSAVSLTTATTANVTSISLTAGDWDVSGNVNFNGGAATITAGAAGITSTSATLPTDGSEAYTATLSTVTTTVDSITLSRKRFSLSGTTTVYLVAQRTFSAGTVTAFGAITARRVR